MSSEKAEKAQALTADLLANTTPAPTSMNPGQDSVPPSESPPPISKPKPSFISYSRKQLLLLSKSPLVQPPSELPPLKDWFGEWTDQHAPSSKKEAADNGVHPRERRGQKKDEDDPEMTARPSFRSTIGATQPSQMGNFRHQSLRMPSISDRVDRDHDRELRDREGQERLRNLSEKFDRERLALASRREAATRSTANTVRSAATRSERREVSSQKDREKDASKRKSEWNEDWRRTTRDESTDAKANPGADSGRDASQEGVRSEEARRRTAGRHRVEPSTDTPVDMTTQLRKTRLDEPTVDPGGEGNLVLEGRRLDKSTNRRRRQASPAETHPTEPETWDSEKPPRDKDRGRTRDGLSKSSGQNRKVQNEEDREPAWMQTYDPEKDGRLAGILGGDEAAEELDGIQVWKQELKAKELQERQAADINDVVDPLDARSKASSVLDLTIARDSAVQPNPVDEIAMFKMMMQREQLKGDSVGLSTIDSGAPLATDRSLTKSRPSNSTSTESGPSENPSHRIQPDYEPPRQSRILSYGIHTSSPSTAAVLQQSKYGVSDVRSPTQRSTPTSQAINPLTTVESLARTEPSPTIDTQVQNLHHSRHANGQNENQRPPINPLLQQQAELYRSSAAPDTHLSIYSSSPSNLGTDTIASPTGTSIRGSSRFAKFFDQKSREGVPPTALISNPAHIPHQTHAGSQDYSRMLSQSSAIPDNEAFQSMLAMLHNSSRSVLSTEMFQRPAPQPTGQQGFNNGVAQPMRVHNYSQSLYSEPPPLPIDSRFSPDGLVPGLKPVRARHVQADPHQTTRVSDPGLQGYLRNFPQDTGSDNLHSHQYSRNQSPSGSRNTGYAGIGGTPVTMHMPQNRLPPGLANLGARPPHDPSQMIHGSHPVGATNIHDTLQVTDFGMPGKSAGFPYRRSPQPSQHASGQPHFNTGINMLGGGGGGDLSPYGSGLLPPSTNANAYPQHHATPIQHGGGMRPQQAQQQYQVLSHHGGSHLPPQTMSNHYPTGQNNDSRAPNDLMALLLRGGIPENR